MVTLSEEGTDKAIGEFNPQFEEFTPSGGRTSYQLYLADKSNFHNRMFTKDGFVNVGEQNYRKLQENWLKVDEANRRNDFYSCLTQEEIIDIVNGIIKCSPGTSFDLPRPVRLKDMIDVCAEIWEADEEA